VRRSNRLSPTSGPPSPSHFHRSSHPHPSPLPQRSWLPPPPSTSSSPCFPCPWFLPQFFIFFGYRSTSSSLQFTFRFIVVSSSCRLAGLGFWIWLLRRCAERAANSFLCRLGFHASCSHRKILICDFDFPDCVGLIAARSWSCS
jgi:hypothetical protein